MKNITHKNDTYELPFKITCTVSGVVKTYTSVEYINGRIDKAGSLELLRSTYVSKSARSSMKKAAKAAKASEVKTETVATTEPEVKSEEPKTENIFKEQIEAAPLPIAKQDKKGMYRNSRGHIIKKDALAGYQLIEFVAEKVA